MDQYTRVGIIGVGYVGNAISLAFAGDPYVTLVKRDPPKGFMATYDELKTCDGIFVCVPSPQSDDGSCDTSYLEGVLQDLKAINYTGVIISKCTAPPNIYTELNRQFPNLVHAPEFLTAANAEQDYANGKFAFIGGAVSAYRREAERLIRLSQSGLEQDRVFHCSIAEASLAKYTLNTFLATKVIYMNELADLAKKLDCDYTVVAKMIRTDHRIGSSHLQVPGPDGYYGFGGACFPKDTAALLKIAEDASVDMNVLNAAVKKNLLLRLTEPK